MPRFQSLETCHPVSNPPMGVRKLASSNPLSRTDKSKAKLAPGIAHGNLSILNDSNFDSLGSHAFPFRSSLTIMISSPRLTFLWSQRTASSSSRQHCQLSVPLGCRSTATRLTSTGVMRIARNSSLSSRNHLNLYRAKSPVIERAPSMACESTCPPASSGAVRRAGLRSSI